MANYRTIEREPVRDLVPAGPARAQAEAIIKFGVR
jgi:hypothetical protein